MSEQIRQLQEYVYTRYVDGGEAQEGVDDREAFNLLSAWFARAEEAESPDCYMPGLMAFELAWGEDEEADRERMMRIAKFWFVRWKKLTGDEAWDPVDLRLGDLEDYFEKRGVPSDPLDPFAGAAPVPGEPEAVATPAPAAPPAPVSYKVREEDRRGPMLFVPAGSFQFGRERRSATTGAFWIDKFPVTNRQYETFCRATGYRVPKFLKDKDPRFSHPDAPVVGVSVADALKYATHVGKDLPTEEQWEKAARGVDGRAYPWGEDETVGDTRACAGRDAATGGTAPVGASSDGASPYGVCDMAGNVWEWTKSTITENNEALHVIKGGCYNDSAELLRADERLEAAPKDKHETVGFRLVIQA